MRKFSKTLAVVSILTPASAYPLGVGDIKMHSALNQKLNADIALVLSGSENISDVQVSLAPPEKFDEAGIPWNYFLSRIEFKTVRQANGATVIHLSSRESLNEPFLDFLLEVSWPKGNIYREFTVLVDPPATYNQTVIPVAIESVAKKTAPVSRSSTSLKKTEISNDNQSINSTFNNGEYGPTNRYDTLWGIAQKVKPSADISDRQMMMALYKANPKAFYKANVNALAAGHTLRVPDKDVILRVSKQQANAEFASQNTAWKAGVDIAAVNNATDNIEQVATKESNLLKLVAPTEAEISDDVVTTAAQTETIGTDAIADSGDLKELNTVNQALETKMSSLEQQLLKMQKMLELKDAQLAALQSQKNIAPVQAQEVEVTPEATTVDTQPPEVLASPTVTELKQKIDPPVEKEPVAPVEKLVAESDSDSGVGSYYLTVGGVGVGIFALLGFLWWKKRKETVVFDTDSMFAGSSEITMPEMEEGLSIPGIEASSTYDVGTVGESSFLSEFTPSDFESFEMDQTEVDPISEADVYLAYGRYKQAEDLMRQAIEDQPGRDECKLKLLEIFYANEDKENYEAYAKELADSGKSEETVFWSKVVEMGTEIIPDSEVFSETKPVQEVADFQSAVEAEDDVNTENALDSENNEEIIKNDSLEANEVTELKEDPIEDGMDFKFELDTELNTAENEPASFQVEEKSLDNELGQEEVESLDFSLTEDESLNEELNADTDTLESFDFSSESPKQADSLEQQEDEIGLSIDIEDQPATELTEMNEFETQIDLAKAYIDMGDTDAAKKIAEEVMDKGNKGQQQAAEDILTKIA